MGSTHYRPADERGQVMSSVVALVAVVAVVVGLLVLFGTWGDDHEADDSTSPSPSRPQSSAPGSGGPTGDPTTGQPTAPPSTPTPAPTRPTVTPTRPTVPTTAPPTSVPIPTRAPSTSGPVSSATGEPTRTSNPGGDQPSQVPVEIYNNTTRRGMADRVAVRLRAAGWTVSGVDNWRGKVVGSTVYYQPGHRNDAEALASKLGIGRVKPALDNMRKGRLTVILTSDYVE